MMTRVSTTSPIGCLKNTKVIRVSLVGLGNIGIHYDVHGEGFIVGQTMTHAKALLESYDFELVSFTDDSLEKLSSAQEIIQKTKVQNENIDLDDSHPDLVVVAVSTAQHSSVVESLTYIPKMLVLEKPVGSNSLECSSISSWASENGVQIFVNYFRRYLSSSIRCRSYFIELNPGNFLSAEISAYGTLLNIYSHYIDLGFFLTNQQIFCECRPKFRRWVGGLLVVSCESCQVSFRFSGIGRLKVDTSLKLEFEYVEVLITEDGKKIEIIDKVDRRSQVFECALNEYNNYQKVVYEKIGEMLRNGVIEHQYLGLEQANWVHLFLESVDLSHGA